MNSQEFMIDLFNSFSPSGNEEPAIEIWENYMAQVKGVNIEREPYGSSIVHLPNDGTSIMLCAHIDEIGFMVKYINDNGYLYMTPIGGIDTNILLGQHLVIHTKYGPIIGVIGSPPVHTLEEDERPSEMSELFVDIGATNKDDALRRVSVGDFATFDTTYKLLPNRNIIGHGLDDKAGVYCIAEILWNLALRGTNKNIYAVASVGEEISSVGAKHATHMKEIDYAIVIDLTFATDYPHMTKEKNGDISLQEGPVINIGHLSHKEITSKLIEIADESYIKYQIAAEPNWTGTDADVISMVREGIKVAVVSIPARYVHTPIEMINMIDVENTIKLITKWCNEV